ncbi:hypothetical protein E2C01_043402 [Portunus trituberculatus]|uniref:Uncharacterized protein n=1 Tax=Portunus trituberculatus TaxID=210409 RepID=A0A5B7FZG3_PORTR|nr:hypothetical protein [Portunus trituberculatus]
MPHPPKKTAVMRCFHCCPMIFETSGNHVKTGERGASPPARSSSPSAVSDGEGPRDHHLG